MIDIKCSNSKDHVYEHNFLDEDRRNEDTIEENYVQEALEHMSPKRILVPGFRSSLECSEPWSDVSDILISFVQCLAPRDLKSFT